MRPDIVMTICKYRWLLISFFLLAVLAACGTLEVEVVQTPSPAAMPVESPTSQTIPLPATPVPETAAAESPVPTPTASPGSNPDPTVEPDDGQDAKTLRVAFIRDGNGMLWDDGQEPFKVTQNGGVESVWLSDDGQRVAFTRDGFLWVVDSDGTNERQLTAEGDFLSLIQDEESDTGITGISLYQVAWRPNSHELYFNTAPQREGPGLFLSDDLWMVDADSGVLSNLLSPGEGGNFTFSPDGRYLAITTPGRIDLLRMEDSDRREVFTHTPVITYSEFEYYAQPIWAQDSNSLRVAVPPADILAPAAQSTSIWHIPVADRPAWLVGQVTTFAALQTPPLLAPNFARLAYQVGDNPEDSGESRPLGLAIAEMSENTIWDPLVYETEIVNMHGWSPDGKRLLFASPAAAVAEIVVGQPTIKALLTADSANSVVNLHWTDNFRFLYQQYDGSAWNLLLGRIDGADPQLIDAGSNFPAAYDFAWVPVTVTPLAEPSPAPESGIPQVDQAIAAILSGDSATRRELLRFSTAGCTHEMGMGGPPKCAADQEEGTPVEYFPILGPGEGQHVPPEAVDQLLEFDAESLHAAFRRQDTPVAEPSFAPGAYVLVFLTGGTDPLVETILVHLDQDGKMVRLDFAAWPLADYFEREVAEWLIAPP